MGPIEPVNPVYIYKVEQIHTVDGIADGDSHQPRSALDRIRVDRTHIAGSIYPVNPGYTYKVEPRSGGAFLLPQPWHSVTMRALIAVLCLLATSALSIVAGCTPSAITPEATCLAYNVTPGTWAFAHCVETVRDKGPSMIRHSHLGGHQ